MKSDLFVEAIYHQVLEDEYVGKAFLVWYYYDGQWLEVAAGD